MRLYNLEGKSHNELIRLKDMVMTHNLLSIAEKEANLIAIDDKLGICNRRNDEVFKNIAECAADIDDLGV